VSDGRTAQSNQAGFTLVETLIALALLSLMSIFATGAVMTMSRSKQVEAKLAERTNIEAVERHLSQTLANMRIVFIQNPEQTPQIVFKGEPTSIEFVAPLSDRLERGGLFVLNYQLNNDDVLTLNYRLLRQQANASQLKSEPLLQNVGELAFRYFGSVTDDADPIWNDQWQRKDKLPKALSIKIDMINGSSDKRDPLIVVLTGGY
jgi:general secretion pathway protein J